MSAANVFRPTFGRKPAVTTDEHFGGCPECGRTDGYVDHGPDHWFGCAAHRTRWYAGSNLFSSWRDEQTAEDRTHLAEVMAYRVVEPVMPPVTGRLSDLGPAAVVNRPEDFARLLGEVVGEDGP